MTAQLPPDVYSPNQLGIVLWELDNLTSQLRNASTRAAVTKQEQATEIHTSALLLGVLHASDVSAKDLHALEQLHKEIELIRDKAPSAHMMLAALPNRAMKRTIIEWFRREIHPNLMLTFAARGDIGGGFILRVGSKQYDFSFRGRILGNKKRLVEIFDSVR